MRSSQLNFTLARAGSHRGSLGLEVALAVRSSSRLELAGVEHALVRRSLSRLELAGAGARHPAPCLLLVRR
jgi:hypothetical protein